MTKSIKKLVAIEYERKKKNVVTFEKGTKYVYLIDPETGKHYYPNAGWEVTGDSLENLFHEVACE